MRNALLFGRWGERAQVTPKNPEAVVLAVDDEPSLLRVIEIELSEQGFHVLKAHNAEEALHVSAKTKPDIAVLDILMPNTSGTELIAKLRERVDIPRHLSDRQGQRGRQGIGP